MIKNLMLCLMFITTIFLESSYAEEIRQELSLNLRVNVLKPVCKLTSGDQTMYFDDFDAVDIVTGSDKTIESTTLNFSGCSNVKKLNITFKQTGQNPSIDMTNNWIPNKTGANMAEGIAVVLLDDKNSEINLGQIMSIDVGQSETSKQIILKAKVVPTDRVGRGILPGKLETAVGIEISYE